MKHLLSALTLAALLLGGCSVDPCDGVTCPGGEVCEAGACVVQAPDGGLDECSIDRDCAGISGRSHCDSLNRRCVQCTVPAHCPDPASQICDLDSHTCAPRPPCTTDIECQELPGTPLCETGSGDCVACLDDVQCTGSQMVCDSVLFVCRFDPCFTDAACTDLAEPLCDVTSGSCVECVLSSQCDVSEICQNGMCVPAGDCARNSDCLAGEVCNTQVGTPACVQCITAADCRIGGACISTECGSGPNCNGDADCAPPLHCAISFGTCVQCISEAHCAAGQTCGATGSCVSPGSCDATSFCIAGEECSGGVCQPANCTDDGFEPNALPYDATPIVPGQLQGTLCPNDWDWYVFAANVGAGLILDLAYDTSNGHPEVLVWAGTGSRPEVIGQPTLTAGGQRLEVTTLSRAGPLRIGLRGLNQSLDYTLDLTVAPDGLCNDDGFEPNDQSSAATPLPDLVAGQTAAAAIACFSDDDWYSVTVPASLRTIATANANDGGPSTALVVSIYVQGTNGIVTLIAGTGINTATAAPRGVVSLMLIKVTHIALGARGYDLTVELKPPRPPNDSCFSPAGLVDNFAIPGTTAGANDDGSTGCGGQNSADVNYTFTLNSAQRVRITTDGALDAVLGLRTSCTNPATELLCSDVPGDVETLDAVLGPGTYSVWVDGFDGREGSFDITLQVSPPPPAPTNEDCGTAIALSEAAGGGVETGDVARALDDYTVGCGGAGGDAVYELVLTSAASLSLSLDGTPGLSVSVRSDCPTAASEVACAVLPSGASADLDLPFLDVGAHTILIDGGGVVGGTYDLTWALGSPIPPPANDDCSSPEPLVFVGGAATTSGDTRNAADDLDVACAVAGQSGGDVVFSLALLQPRQLVASVGAGHDATLELRGAPCSGGTTLQCSDAVSPSLYEPALPSGIYYLIVDGYDGERGAFTLDVTTSSPLALPPGDTCAGASVLDVSSGSASASSYTHLASNDVDLGNTCTGSSTGGLDVVYAVELTAGQVMTASVTPTSAWDPALYVIDDCAAPSCLAGVDDFFVTSPESTSYTAAGAETVYIVVDSFSPASKGFFDLQVDVQ